MHYLARLFLGVFLVLCETNSVLNYESSCSDFITFSSDNNFRLGSFKVQFPQTNDSFVQVVVYVGDQCKNGPCFFFTNGSQAQAIQLYQNSREVSYQVHTQHEAQHVTVEGVALKTSSTCRLLCGSETRNFRPLKYTLYPYGRPGAVGPECSLVRASYYGDAGCGLVASHPSARPLALWGQEIERGSWPWLAAVYSSTSEGDKFLCGGTLIHQRVILTAAHCLFDERGELSEEDYFLLMGIHNRSNQQEAGFFRYEVVQTEIHPDYDNHEVKFDSDIALLYTDSIVRYTDLIRPACLWDDDDPIEDLVSNRGVVVGWGIDEYGSTSWIPKRVVGGIVSHRECYDSNPIFSAIITRRNFCAGNRDGSGPCTGDSGGAFMIYASERWITRGVVAGSIHSPVQTCDLSHYVVYTDVSKYKNWITERLPRGTIGSQIPENEIECGVIPSSFEPDGSWPWDVRFAFPGFDVEYPGALISRNAIVTKAHFFAGNKPDQLLVKVAPYKNNAWNATKSERYIHPDYNQYTEQFDIAIIKFEKLNLPDFVVPSCLWTGSDEIEDIVGREIQATCLNKPRDPNRKFISRITDTKKCEELHKNIPNFTYIDDFCGDLEDLASCDYKVRFEIYIYEAGKWMLRGLRRYLGRISGVNTMSVANIVPFLPWINQHIN